MKQTLYRYVTEHITVEEAQAIRDNEAQAIRDQINALRRKLRGLRKEPLQTVYIRQITVLGKGGKPKGGKSKGGEPKGAKPLKDCLGQWQGDIQWVNVPKEVFPKIPVPQFKPSPTEGPE